jgi:hypothetical protein
MSSALDLPDFAPGDELTADDLNRIVGWLRAHELDVSPGSGLTVVKHAGGQSWSVADTGDAGDWYKIRSHVTAGQYTVRRQLDDLSGAWADATPTDVNAWESNAVALLDNGLVVWCEPAGTRLKFTKGVCP